MDELIDSPIDRQIAETESIARLHDSLELLNRQYESALGLEAWSPENRRSYELGVQQIFAVNGVSLSDSMLSTESSGSVLDKGKELLVRLWEAFKASLDKLVDLAFYLAESWGKNQRAVLKMADVLTERLERYPTTYSARRFPDRPQWSSYLKQDGVTLEPLRALKLTAELTEELGYEWTGTYSALATLIARQLDQGGVVDDAFVGRGQVVFRTGSGAFPGGYQIGLTYGTGTPTLLNQRISVVRTVAGVDSPEVLGDSGIRDVIKGLRMVAVSMGHVTTQMKSSAAALRSLKSSINASRAVMGPSILARAVKQSLAGPRVLLPIAGSICQNAFRHANQSIRLARTT